MVSGPSKAANIELNLATGSTSSGVLVSHPLSFSPATILPTDPTFGFHRGSARRDTKLHSFKSPDGSIYGQNHGGV